jgi:hypothetical protein
MVSRRSASVAGAVLVAAAVVVLSATASADSGDTDDRETTLRFDVQTSPFNLTDLGEPGISAADVIVFDDRLLQDGRQVGHQVGSCTVVDASALADCTAVVTLDDRGTITFAFENAPPPEKTVAVTGGSGEFRTAHGDGVFSENADQTATLTLSLVLAPDR